MHKLPHLYKNRFGVYYLRLVRNGREAKKSLRTKDYRQAKIWALSFNLELAMSKPGAADFDLSRVSAKDFDVVLPDGTQIKNIETAEDVRLAKEMFGDRLATLPPMNLPVFTPAMAAAIAAQQASASATTAKPSKPFASVAKLYAKEKALDNTPRTILAKERAFADFQRHRGARPIGDYALEDAVEHKNKLIDDGGSASRVNSRLSFLRDIFAYAIANGHRDGPNPFAAAKVSSKSKLQQQKRSYKPFSADDLATIFDPTAYKARMDKPAYRWLPFLALYSGARLEELASLRIDLLQSEGGIWFFDIQKAKNSNSQRRIPLHRTVLESGFMAYVDGLRERGATQLFPELKPGANGYGKNVTRRFADYLDERKIVDDRKVFHSFRHTFIGRMTELNVHPAMLMALVGHYDQAKVDFSSPHFANYQHAKPLQELKATLDRFDIVLPLFFLNFSSGATARELPFALGLRDQTTQRKPRNAKNCQHDQLERRRGQIDAVASLGRWDHAFSRPRNEGARSSCRFGPPMQFVLLGARGV
ncbi:putative phage-related integrase [Burkholderia gladioli BSR3]|uniref:Putative phage-related integrase n=2 Tax=Burkholderia gladioli TaxID=28095 RepID=F2LAF0_BURGS|nr:putative phage-related integrase [Burkholderia gladioli BSR3]